MASISTAFHAEATDFSNIEQIINALRSRLEGMTVESIEITVLTAPQLTQPPSPAQPLTPQPTLRIEEPDKHAVSLSKYGYYNVVKLNNEARRECLNDAIQEVGVDRVLAKLAFLKSVNDMTEYDSPGVHFKNDYEWLVKSLTSS